MASLRTWVIDGGVLLYEQKLEVGRSRRVEEDRSARNKSRCTLNERVVLMLRRNEISGRFSVTTVGHSIIIALHLDNKDEDTFMTNDDLMVVYNTVYVGNKDRFKTKYRYDKRVIKNFGDARVTITVGQDLNFRTFDACTSRYDISQIVPKIINVWRDVHIVREKMGNQTPEDWGFENCRWCTDKDFTGQLDVTIDMPHFTNLDVRDFIKSHAKPASQYGTTTSAFCICHAEEAEFKQKPDNVPMNTAHIVFLPQAFLNIFSADQLSRIIKTSEKSWSEFRADVTPMEAEIINDVFVGYVAHELNHVLESFYLVKEEGSNQPADTGSARPEDYDSGDAYSVDNDCEWRSNVFASLFSENFKNRVRSHRSYMAQMEIETQDDDFCRAVEIVKVDRNRRHAEQNKGYQI